MSTQTTIDSDELLVGTEWIKPQGSYRISVHAAGTEELVGSLPDGTNGDIDAAVNAARGAFEDPSEWSSWSAEDRAQAVERLAGALESGGGNDRALAIQGSGTALDALRRNAQAAGWQVADHSEPWLAIGSAGAGPRAGSSATAPGTKARLTMKQDERQRHARTKLVCAIFGGTSEIQRETIAKNRGLSRP